MPKIVIRDIEFPENGIEILENLCGEGGADLDPNLESALLKDGLIRIAIHEGAKAVPYLKTLFESGRYETNYCLADITRLHAGRRFYRISWPTELTWSILEDGSFRQHVEQLRHSQFASISVDDITAYDWRIVPNGANFRRTA